MEQFKGFPTRTQFTPLPNIFFSALLEQISDIAELKITLYIIANLYRKQGYPRFINRSDLLDSASLRRSLKQTGQPPAEALDGALAMATRRGTILHLTLEKGGAAEDIYFLNNEQSREAIIKIEKGELKLAGLKTGPPACPEPDEPPDIFTLYEQNIGMLTPMIAEELKEAEQLYPLAWIRDAVKEAVNQNKRKWSYISAILERWTSEGRESGTYRRDSKKEDPNKYIKGKYGHMVQR
ncbi:DnaD domain-containing protein [Chloroflexota bacterium]